jgi:hypothetical protein
MNMKMIEISALPNGAHRNQTFHGNLPDGWAVVPDDMAIPATFPFVNIKAEEVVTESENEVHTVMTVTSMTAGVMPEVKPEEPMPTQLDIIEAQVTYTAMMTDTLLGG